MGAYRDESGNIQTITLKDFEKHIPPDILGPTTEGTGSALINQELDFLEKCKGIPRTIIQHLKQLHPVVLKV